MVEPFNAVVKVAVRRAGLSDKMAAGHPKAQCGGALQLHTLLCVVFTVLER